MQVLKMHYYPASRHFLFTMLVRFRQQTPIWRSANLWGGSISEATLLYRVMKYFAVTYLWKIFVAVVV